MGMDAHFTESVTIVLCTHALTTPAAEEKQFHTGIEGTRIGEHSSINRRKLRYVEVERATEGADIGEETWMAAYDIEGLPTA